VTGTSHPAWWPAADAYLRLGVATGFAAFGRGAGNHVALLLEFAAAIDDVLIARLDAQGIVIPGHYDGYRFATATIPCAPDRISDALDALLANGALRMELAAPVASLRPTPVPAGPQWEHLNPATLVGVIDDGLPFAHAALRRSARPGRRTSVAMFWDQDGQEPAAGTPSAYGYGRVHFAGHLDACIAAGTLPDQRSVDEDAVYRSADSPRLRPLATHGAHVAGLLADPVPLASRIPSSRYGDGDATRPPSWNPDAATGNVTYAFVQIPRASLDDSSGRWLGRNVLDGIHAILAFAQSGAPFTDVVINLSYGPQTGRHDGRSLLERAINALVEHCNGTNGPKVSFVVPAGNSYLARAHAEFRLAKGGGTLDWFVSPDSELPSFLELWLPHGCAPGDVAIRVEAPDATQCVPQVDDIVAIGAQYGHAIFANAAAGSPPRPETDEWVVLLALRPTSGFDAAPRAPHGVYKVTVTPRSTSAWGDQCVHAYLARNDANFGGSRRGQSGFLRAGGMGSPRLPVHLPATDTSGLPVAVCAAGTLSGLATANGARFYVAAGCTAAHDEEGRTRPTEYSSGGPTRDESIDGRTGPDWAFVTDETRTLTGVRSWGTRSGASVRLMGTSAAAPQLARMLAEHGEMQRPHAPDSRVGDGRKPHPT